MPELSDVTFSKIVVIKLINCSLKISRSAINITRIKTSSIVVIAATYFLSLFFLINNFLILYLSFFSLFFSNLNRQKRWNSHDHEHDCQHKKQRYHQLCSCLFTKFLCHIFSFLKSFLRLSL